MGRGTQRGYISRFIDERYGFITEDGSPGRGLYFQHSDVKSAGVQLCCGMCVQFKVDENDKGCIAREVSVATAQVWELFLQVLKLSKPVVKQFLTW